MMLGGFFCDCPLILVRLSRRERVIIPTCFFESQRPVAFNLLKAARTAEMLDSYTSWLLRDPSTRH